MNHDYAHCSDYKPSCPEKCFRAQLARDIENNPQPRVSYISFEGTEECKRKVGEVEIMVLPIKRHWLEMIRSGRKKEEYRALSPYYAARFKKYIGLEFKRPSPEYVEEIIRAAGDYGRIPFKDIILRAGYSAMSPATMISGHITIGKGRKEWGAEEETEYYVLHIEETEDLLTDGKSYQETQSFKPGGGA